MDRPVGWEGERGASDDSRGLVWASARMKLPFAELGRLGEQLGVGSPALPCTLKMPVGYLSGDVK